MANPSQLQRIPREPEFADEFIETAKNCNKSPFLIQTLELERRHRPEIQEEITILLNRLYYQQ
ncbi:MAG: hypothetical protein HUJ26_18900 [Planctomycetaceae bacterium]|nr:hypothetical protein [Planctomycetaceae bacterium]